MQEPTINRRQCPTRPNGAEVLIEQRISGTTCQERQRKHYHKCYSCIHRNDLHVSASSNTATAAKKVALPPIDRTPLGALEVLPTQSKAKAEKTGKQRSAKSKNDARQAG